MLNITYVPFDLAMEKSNKAVIRIKGVTALFHSTKKRKNQFAELISTPLSLHTNKKIELSHIKWFANKLQAAFIILHGFLCFPNCRGPPSEFWFPNRNSKFGGKTNGK